VKTVFWVSVMVSLGYEDLRSKTELHSIPEIMKRFILRKALKNKQNSL